MARFPNGILGGLVGTIGPVIGSSLNGVPYLKSRYAKRKVTNHPNEIANRKKFAAARAKVFRVSGEAAAFPGARGAGAWMGEGFC